MVTMKATDKMKPGVARRMQYRTRMLSADILAGQEFELSASDARILRKTGYAEEVTGAKPTTTRAKDATSDEAPKRRGRPPKPMAARPVPEPKSGSAQSDPEDTQDPYRDKTVSELRQMAEDRDIELPSGYVTHDELVKRLLQGGKT